MAALFSGWGADPFAEQVEKATSELLPVGQEDIALNLDICDQVRAKQVQPKQAMQVIKRRISHKNPNVVLLALGLTDICIKNGGDHFLQEVASREFMDNLVSVLKSPTGVNHDVKSKALGLIQNWAQIAEAKPSQMAYINEIYRDLKRDSKFEFPPRDPKVLASAALVETLTAPEWVDGDVCLRCRTAFTTFNRKHHCRNCGNVFCQQCSSHSMALPWFGIGQDVRVCDACHTRKAPPKNAAKLSRSKSASSPSKAASLSSPSSYAPSGRGGAASHQRSLTVGGKPRKGGRSSKEDDDLALAIKLSLESSGGAAAYASSPNSAPSAPGRATRQADGRMLEGTDADDDPDLAAAIAASLRDWAPPQPSAPDGLSSSQPSQGFVGDREAAAAHAGAPAENLNLPPSLDLAPGDVDSLLTFAQTVQAQDAYNRSHGVSGAPPHQQAQALYEKASAARPKVARSLEEGHRRHGVLVSMHEKLAEAVRLYDHLLDAQMSRPAASYGYGQAQETRFYAAPSNHQQQPLRQPSGGIYPAMPPVNGPAAAAPAHNYHHAQQSHTPVSASQAPYAEASRYPLAAPHGVPSMSTTPQPRHYREGYGAAVPGLPGANASASPVQSYASTQYQQHQQPYATGDAYLQHGPPGAYSAPLAPDQQVGVHHPAAAQEAYGSDAPSHGVAAYDHSYRADGYAGSQAQTPQPGAHSSHAQQSYAQGSSVEYRNDLYDQAAAGANQPHYLGYAAPTNGALASDPQQQQAHLQHFTAHQQLGGPQSPHTSLDQGTVHINGYGAAPDTVAAQRRRSTDTLASSSTGWNNIPIEQVSPAPGNSATLNAVGGAALQHAPNDHLEQQPQQQPRQQQATAPVSPPTIKTTAPNRPTASDASYLPLFPIAPHADNALGPSSSQSELVSPASANTNGRSSAGMWQQPSAAHPQAAAESPLIEF